MTTLQMIDRTYRSTKLLLELINDCVCHLLFLYKRRMALNVSVPLVNFRHSSHNLFSPHTSHMLSTNYHPVLSTESKPESHQRYCKLNGLVFPVITQHFLGLHTEYLEAFLKGLIYYYVCMCMMCWVCVYMHTWMWRSEDNFVELVLSFYLYVDVED